MQTNVKDYVTQKLKDMMDVPYCCAEAKTAAQNWLDAVGTDKEAEAAKNLIAELKEDIMPIDGLIAFIGSDAGVKVFGEEAAKKELARNKERKSSGAQYCDCPACAAAIAVLEKEEELL